MVPDDPESYESPHLLYVYDYIFVPPLTDNEKEEVEKFRTENTRFVKSKKNSYFYMGQYHSGLTAFMSIITICVIFFGALFISDGSIDTPDLIAFLLYVNNLTEPIKKLLNFTEQFQEGATGFERFMEILEIQPDIKDSDNALTLNNVEGHVQFKDVSFRYNEKNGYVFENLNLEVNSGEYIALVGSSGVGYLYSKGYIYTDCNCYQYILHW